ncbi:MAG: UbiA prenyltransferase family protein [Deltaproteobacteria bacterium]|nr:UbiA prenyltransferase family protein [Deltaproteobacteria bacterium]
MPPAALDRFVQRVTSIQYHPYHLVVVPVLVGLVRAALEALVGYRAQTPIHAFTSVLFYLVVQLLLLGVVSLATGRRWREIAGAVTVGLVLGWVPPLLEWVAFAQPGRAFRYLNEFRWHFVAPYQSVWESVGIWLAIVFAGGFTALVTRRLWRALAALAGAWVAMQVAGWACPAAGQLLAVDRGLRGVSVANLSNLVLLLVALVVYLALNPGTLLPSLRRINHCLPWGLVAMLGARLTGQFWTVAALRGVIMTLGFLLIVFTNDYFDRGQDAARGGQARPIAAEDMVVATWFEVLLCLWVGFWDPRGIMFVAIFFVLALLYHHPALRLKRLFCAAYTIEGAAATCCLLFGLGSVHNSTWARAFAALTFGGFALGSMFKDYKDIDQDRADKVGTVYTRYLARGRSLRGIHLVVSVALALGMLVPPLWLLTRGAPLGHALLLFALAPVMLLCLLRGADRRAVVERSFWCLSAYLAAFVAVAPQLG